VRDLTKMVASTEPGRDAKIVVWRDGKGGDAGRRDWPDGGRSAGRRGGHRRGGRRHAQARRRGGQADAGVQAT
jgi:hypothetical protein